MKRLILTGKAIFDNKGKWLGREVIEVDGFTSEEVKKLDNYCKVCTGANGVHKEVWVITGQGGGNVDGYYTQCPNR